MSATGASSSAEQYAISAQRCPARIRATRSLPMAKSAVSRTAVRN